MGQSVTKYNKSRKEDTSRIDKSMPIQTMDIIEYDENNGLILHGIYLPIEVILLILSFVDSETLRKSCPLVCKNWSSIIIDYVWKIKAERLVKKKLRQLSWKAYFHICCNKYFDTNLIINPYGEDGLNGWKITQNGGHQWIVENTPQGCAVLPLDEFGDKTKCFATSFRRCSKFQEIDLLKYGFTSELLKCQPYIYFSEWYGTRFDCGCIYNLHVTLSDKNRCILKEFEFSFSEDQFQGGTWDKIEYVFEHYDPSVRYITFYNDGQDTQFWAGHYGSKMSGATVKVILNSLSEEFVDDHLKQITMNTSRKGKSNITVKDTLHGNCFSTSDDENTEFDLDDRNY